MKTPDTVLRTAYVALLAGITHGGRAVKVYDTQAPTKAVPPYVLVLSQTGQADNTKTTFGRVQRVTLSVVTQWADGTTSKEDGEAITNLVAARLNPEPGVSGLGEVEGFNVYLTTIEAVADLDPLMGETGGVQQKIITVKHLIEQV